MTRAVCDASALVALLTYDEPDAAWTANTMHGRTIFAPTLLRFECAHILRRHESAGFLGTAEAAQAHADLLEMPIEEWPYAALAGRAWQLRTNLTTYDASYVALAELIDAPLVTLDRRIARASGLVCQVLTPP